MILTYECEVQLKNVEKKREKRELRLLFVYVFAIIELETVVQRHT